jgi:hypothetical protein
MTKRRRTYYRGMGQGKHVKECAAIMMRETLTPAERIIINNIPIINKSITHAL